MRHWLSNTLRFFFFFLLDYGYPKHIYAREAIIRALWFPRKVLLFRSWDSLLLTRRMARTADLLMPRTGRGIREYTPRLIDYAYIAEHTGGGYTHSLWVLPFYFIVMQPKRSRLSASLSTFQLRVPKVC